MLEEKLSANKGKYLYNVMFSNGTKNKNLYSSLENLMASTKIQVGAMAKRWDDTHKTDALQNDDRISLDIKDKLNEPNEYDMKLSYNNHRIFDGWFHLNSIIRRYAREQIPAFIKHLLVELKKQDMEFLCSDVFGIKMCFREYCKKQPTSTSVGPAKNRNKGTVADTKKLHLDVHDGFWQNFHP